MNPNGKVFKIDDACPLLWVFAGIIGFFISIAFSVSGSESKSLAIIITFLISIACFLYGWLNKGKNTSYIIDSKNNCFFVPLRNEPFCKLSDIHAVNKRQESRKKRGYYQEDGKKQHRTVTTYTYYVQIVGEEISTDFSFSSQGKRDELYSSLKIGIKDVRDFLKGGN